MTATIDAPKVTPRDPILMLTQHGYYAAAAFVLTMAAYCAKGPPPDAPKNRPHTATHEKLTTYGGRLTQETAKNRPHIQWGRREKGIAVAVVVRREELEALLLKAGWWEWLSPVRVCGLLLMVADAVDRLESGRFDFSRDRARCLCSPLPKTVRVGVPREGLAILTGLGIFAPVSAATSYPRACPAVFCLGKLYASRSRFQVVLPLTPARADKWHRRDERVREAYERGRPVIGAVRRAASRATLSDEGVREILRLRTTAPDSFDAAYRCSKWMDEHTHRMAVDAMGTVHTPVSGCPKVIRRHVLIDGEAVAEADISGAHLVVLTKVYEPAFLKSYRVPHTATDAEEEKKSLVAMIESGDVYGGGADDERKKWKKELLTSLNMNVTVQMAMEITQRLTAGRPILTATLGAVKAGDHRALSWWMQRWTSDIVNGAVVALDAEGIPSIPIVDCLMVRRQDEERARQELSSRIFEATGVRATVGGIRHTFATAS
jgi:hypothetical protein